MAFNWGAAAPAPAAGGLFGAAPAPAPALFNFGGAAPAPAPAPAFAFGAPAPAPAPFAFGAPAPAPAAGGFFGFGAPAPAPAAAWGGFGGGGLFGQPAAAASAPAAAQPPPRDPRDVELDNMVRVIAKYAIADAGVLGEVMKHIMGFMRSQPGSYKWKAVTFNEAAPNVTYTKPALLTPEEWDAARASSARDDTCDPPVDLVPVALDSFQDVTARMEQQDKRVAEMYTAAEQLLKATKAIQLQCEQAMSRHEALAERQLAFVRRLINVAAKVDAVVARGVPETEHEIALRRKLLALRESLEKTAALQSRLQGLQVAVQLRQEAGGPQAGAAAGPVGAIDDVDAAAIADRLELQRRGIEQLVAILRKDRRDLGIVVQYLEKLGIQLPADVGGSQAEDALANAPGAARAGAPTGPGAW